MPANNCQSKMIYDPHMPQWLCLINKGYEYDVRIEWSSKGYWATEVSKCDGLCIKDDFPFIMRGTIKAEIRLLISLYENPIEVYSTERIEGDFFDNIPVPKEAKK